MASISWQGLTGFVRQFVASVQAAANAAVDSTDGSITLALGQASTGAALWLQAQIAKVLSLTRASTSFGTDLDTWMADWFFKRLPAVEATSTETLSRFTSTLQAVCPVGSLFSTGPGGVQFIVTTDITNPAYNAALNGYVAAPSIASATVPISAVMAGTTGNVLENTITSFVQPIVGFDTCTNPADIENGVDAESDPSFLARFQDYIQSLRKGTVLAIRFAILSIRSGLTCEIVENKDTDGTTDNGFLTIIVDDGTGSPSMDLLTSASDTIDLDVRAAGIRYAVIGPTVVPVVITLTVVSADATLHSDDIVAAENVILEYVNALTSGATLIWSRLYQLAFDASDNITSVNSILINGGTSDITVSGTGVIKTTSVTVS